MTTKKDLFAKKEDNLVKLVSNLKKDYFGIDEVLDDVSELIRPWYFIPESAIRPQIISLWGMTGTGKTSMVRRIAEELGYDLIELDLGEFSKGDRNFSTTFYTKYFEYTNTPIIILIDEFHICRTVDSQGGEMDRDGIRGLWSLLSDGNITINDKASGSIDLEDILMDSIEEWEEAKKTLIDYRESKDKEEISEVARIKKRKNTHYLQTYYLKQFSQCIGVSYRDLIERTNEDLFETVNFLMNKLKNVKAQPKLDFTKALIFVSGNLDDLYIASKDFDPDFDLEVLHEDSKTLTVSEVKQCLFDRFRPEQIGRLGNNHIIYPSLNKNAYRSIIRHDLDRIKDFYKNKFWLNLDFEIEDSVVDVVYGEGVFPAQGARSVLSTVISIAEPAIVRFVYKFVCNEFEATKIKMSFNQEKKKFIFAFNDKEIEVSTKLKIDEFRIPKLNNKTISIAVHEAGHVLLGIVVQGDVPSKVTAFTLGFGNEGTTTFPYIKDELYSYSTRFANMVVGMGGWAAEEMIFGVDNVSFGASADLKRITNFACLATHQSGMTKEMGFKTKGEIKNTLSIRKEDEAETREWINKSKDEAMRILRLHKKCIAALADGIVSNSLLVKEDIIKIVEPFGILENKKFNYVESFKKFEQD